MRVLAVVCLSALLVPAAASAHDRRSSADLPLPELASYPAFAPVSQERSTRAELEALVDARPSGGFELVGHEPLLNRGMNSAIAVHNGHVYVGSRTDGTHVDAGVLVVDVGDPSKPAVVNQIGPPNAAMPGESSRELRVLPRQNLLMVLNHGCSELIHRCVNASQAGASISRSRIDFYDIAGEKAAAPELVATYLPSKSAAQQPHEFFIWNDPKRPGRVLMYSTTPSSDTGTGAQLVVTDLSKARQGLFPEIAKWRTTIGNPDRDNRLHSLTVSSDGRRAFLAYLGGGFLVADTSDFANHRPLPEVRLVTPVESRVFWTDPGAHSAVKLPNRPFALTTDEVYGKLGGALPKHGCPWGWVRMIDIRNQTRPRVASEFRLPVNDPNQCAGTPADRENLSSFSAHNPTLTQNLAFVTWHSAGLQAIDISDPAKPRSAAQYVPEPLAAVQTDDPALSQGRDKVVMWSFPVIKDGLIYTIDLRNGLYIFRYRGRFEREVARTKFLDGNSNSGDAMSFR
jgi:hypothetical protein